MPHPQIGTRQDGGSVIGVTKEGKTQPEYRRVADGVRAKIEALFYLPGHPIPSESALRAEYSASRNTVREAIKLLREMGLIETQHGRASYVRPTPEWRVLHLYPNRVPMEAVRAKHTELAVKVYETAADRNVAAALKIPEGTPLVARRSVLTVRGVPHQLGTSYLLRATAAGTPLAEENSEAVERTEDHLAALGITVTAVDRTISARMPTLDERDDLHIGAIPVITITRVMLAGDEPVEASVDIVIRADAVKITHRTEL
jgi:GntR family transcriptional regulator